MIVKILEKIAEGDFVPKSPEGRGGRERALRPGAAAVALRGATANDLSSSNHELDDEFADTGMQWTHALPVPLRSNVSEVSATLVDPIQQIEGDPWRGRAAKF